MSKEIETSSSALETPDKMSESPLYLFSSYTLIPFYAFCQLLILLQGACRRSQSNTTGNAPHWGSMPRSLLKSQENILYFKYPKHHRRPQFKGGTNDLNDLKA